MMSRNPLHWLQGWYLIHCNGDWEHQCGIKIGTLDNPGWFLEIDLKDTIQKEKIFDRVRVDRSEEDWFEAWSEKDVFHACGGVTNLEEMIGVFRNWVDNGI